MLDSHLLSVGYDKTLMNTRAMVLRHAGFVVDQTFNLRAALALVKSDSIDAMLICHTVTTEEQRCLISAVRDARKLLPIICVSEREFAQAPGDCLSCTNEPSQLIEIIKKAVHPGQSPFDSRVL